jgi:hypothetical protein
MCSDAEKSMPAYADQNHAPSLMCVRLEAGQNHMPGFTSVRSEEKMYKVHEKIAFFKISCII